jgi:hypothetical protein
VSSNQGSRRRRPSYVWGRFARRGKVFRREENSGSCLSILTDVLPGSVLCSSSGSCSLFPPSCAPTAHNTPVSTPGVVVCCWGVAAPLSPSYTQAHPRYILSRIFSPLCVQNFLPTVSRNESEKLPFHLENTYDTGLS